MLKVGPVANKPKFQKPPRVKIVGPKPSWADTTQPDPDSVPDPMRLLHCSEKFLRALWALERADPEVAFVEHSPVYDYLLGHALELSLKAFLAAHGRTEGYLHKVGHDLEAALGFGKELGITRHVLVSTKEELALVALNRVYEAKHLEYLHTKHQGMFLQHAELEGLALRLLDGLWEACAFSKASSEDPDCVSIFRQDYTRWRGQVMPASVRVTTAHLGAGTVGFFQNFMSEEAPFSKATTFLIGLDSGFRGVGDITPRDRTDGLDAWLSRRAMRKATGSK